MLKAEINKGKHEAVLEAAIDAKQLVEEDSSPGLNAHDAIKNFGSSNGWAKINSVCYNTSIEQASTGCMNFLVAGMDFNMINKLAGKLYIVFDEVLLSIMYRNIPFGTKVEIS